MESASQHSPKRLLRLAIAGGILATAWFVVDAITHSDPAAAAESIDLIPIGDGSAGGAVGDLLETATTLVAPVVEPVVATVVAPVTTPVLAPVGAAVDTAVSPVLTPALGTVGELLAPVTAAVIEPLSPVLVPVTAPLMPALEAALGPVTLVDSLVETAQSVPALRPDGTVLSAGGAVILGAVLGAVVSPLLPAPSNGGPLNVPLAPAAPSGSNGSTSAVLCGELNSGVPAGIGALGTAGAKVGDLPSSPTFASDTTPD